MSSLQKVLNIRDHVELQMRRFNLNKAITYTVSVSLLNAKICTTSHVPEVRNVMLSLPGDCEDNYNGGNVTKH